MNKVFILTGGYIRECGDSCGYTAAFSSQEKAEQARDRLTHHENYISNFNWWDIQEITVDECPVLH